MKWRAVYWAMVGLLFTGICSAQGTDEDQVRDAWSKVYLEAAQEVKLSSNASDEPITLEQRPLLKWHNPVRPGQTHGDFFVWRRSGLPVAVGTLFSFINRSNGATRVAAFDLHPLVAEDLDYEFRATRGTLHGARLSTISVSAGAASDAAATAAKRLAQLRGIARSCEAWTVSEGVEQPLRLLSQPLLVASGAAEQVAAESQQMDSAAALFAMVTGTDPELLLWIRPGERTEFGAITSWLITPARFTDLPLKVSVKGETVWDWRIISNSEPHANGRLFELPLDPR